MTPVGQALGDHVLLGPRGLRVVRASMQTLQAALRRDGIGMPADALEVLAAVEAAVAHAGASAGCGSPAVPFAVVGGESALLDPVTTQEAARMLGTQARNVRDLCGRGSLPARKVGGRWFIERADVLERVAG